VLNRSAIAALRVSALVPGPSYASAQMTVGRIRCALACVALTGCCSGPPQPGVEFSTTVRLSEFYVGDTTTVIGTWTINSAPICPPKEVYNSRTSPSKFTFRVLDTAIATVSSAGLVTARAVGETRVYARINDEESPGEFLRIYARPSSELRAQLRRSTQRRRSVRYDAARAVSSCWARSS
jgi:Bacterial Ig-like domain (group 2)